MKREFLKELGLEDDAIDKIMVEHGKSVNDMKEKADNADTLQKQLDDRDKQLKKLSKQAEGNEELQQTIKNLQKENDDAKKEHDANLAKVRKEAKLELALNNAKARNSKAVKALLDDEKISLDGDNLVGLDDQLKELQKSASYLFDTEEKNPGLKGRQAHASDPHKQSSGGNDLQKQYDEAVKSGNTALAVSLKNKLFEEQQNQNGE